MNPVDRHTLFELQIIAENNRSSSIFKYFDHTKTPSGSDYLKMMITQPKQSLAELTSFQQLLKTISSDAAPWQIDTPRAYVVAAESYYALNVAHSMSQDVFKHWFDTWIFSIRNPEEFYRIQSGLIAVLKLLRAFRKTLDSVERLNIPIELAKDISRHQQFLSSYTLKSLLEKNKENLSKSALFYLDFHFRVKHKDNLRELLDLFYRFDAWLAIIRTEKLHKLDFPVIAHNGTEFNLDAAWHPLLENPVKNSITLSADKSVCILTGANTSGKTTFLKTSGIIIYLAHLGWPVPAFQAHIPFLDQLFTSIHLSDDLDSGYSHFSGEIMRVKGMFEALHSGDECCVLIDELFRGTNQEDALFCSRTVLGGFSGYQNSFFLVSTHLLKLVEDYENAGNVTLKCFKTKISGIQFENSFQIEDGIASEKVGSLILRQSGMMTFFKK